MICANCKIRTEKRDIKYSQRIDKRNYHCPFCGHRIKDLYVDPNIIVSKESFIDLLTT